MIDMRKLFRGFIIFEKQMLENSCHSFVIAIAVTVRENHLI